MFEWLFGKKKAKVSFPVYDELKRNPSRGLPEEIREREGGPDYQLRHSVHEQLFREYVTMQPDETPWFMVPVTSQGVIMLRNPDGDGQSLLIFSSQFRCLDYGMTQMADLTMVRLLPQNLRQIVELLRKVENADVRHFVLDRCPRCSYALVVRTEPFQTPEEFRELFIHQKATELARQELYFEFAIYSAQNGNTQLALDVALETVGHVTMEHPNIHYLIGQLAVSLKRPSLLEEARAFLRFLKAEDYLEQLRISEATGQPNFEVRIW